MALVAWAKPVFTKARTRLEEAMRRVTPAPNGYLGLKEQMSAAKNALVFGPEDHAPHGVFFACGR